MNKRLVINLLGELFLIEALAMLPSVLVAQWYGDGDALALLFTVLMLTVAGGILHLLVKPKSKNMRAREGYAIVALAWILFGMFGALPYVFSGVLTNYVDALFETVSGFTTTGATLIKNIDGMPRGIAFYRCYTHWVGGMGVLVLSLALLPQLTGNSSHLVRAEAPGPGLSKIAPRMSDNAKLLYVLYGALTFLLFIVLMIAGMSPYDAILHAMSTAGTGGFSNYGASVAAFNSPLIDAIITIFMLLFGLNFALLYSLCLGRWKDVTRNEELRWYVGMVVVAILGVTIAILPKYSGFFEALRYGSFQVASIISTTGFATADFNLWPEAARIILLIVMLCGSCVGSTAGGMKTMRVALLCKLCKREVRRTIQPHSVKVIRFERKGQDEEMLSRVGVFFFVYIAVVILGTLLLAINNSYDFETNFTASLTCVSNVGPGFGGVGPTENFSGFPIFSKLVFITEMLCGRLEFFPIFAMFSPKMWHKQ